MENIVTGQDNDPRQEAQEGRPNIPRGTQSSATESPGTVVGDSMGEVIGDLPLKAQSQEMLQEPLQGETTGVGFDSHIPAVSIGQAPYLTNNPRVQMLLPDIPNYQEQMRQMPIEDRSPRLLDMNLPSPFRTPLPPLANDETLQRISEQFGAAIRQRNATELHSRLRQFVDYQPWKYADTTSEPSSVSTSIPSSTSTVPDRLYSPFGIGNRGRSGDIISSNPVVQNLSEQLGAAVRTLGGLGQDALEFAQGNRDGRLFNNTVREGLAFLESVQGVPTGEPNQYRFNPLRGEFGELGRGWVGAVNYAMNLPEQLAWASVYSTLDLGRAIGQAIPSLQEIADGAPLIDMTRVNMPSEFNQPFYRYIQAATGVDLDLVNFNDSGGNRYLAMIPADRPLNEQIVAGGIGFLGSLMFGSVVDNGIQILQRRAPMIAEGLRRGNNLPQSIAAANRLDRVQQIRRASRPVPTFEPVEERPLTRTPDNLPELEDDYDNLIRQAANRGDNAEAARLVRESAQRASNNIQSRPANIPVVNISPTEMAQTLRANPQMDVPLPSLRPRTNAELSYVARQLGILREQHVLSNEQIDVLGQLFPDTFQRFGSPINVGDDITEAIRQAPTPEEAGRIVRESARLIQEQNDELRRAFQNGTEIPESAYRRAEQIANMPPTEKISLWGDEVPSYLRNVDENTARQLLRNEDVAVAASHGMQQLEGEIDTLRFEILKQGSRLDGDLGKFTRGNVADEIQTWAQHGRVIPGTQVQELLPPEVPNLTGTIGGNWYHGTRQADIFGVNFHHGTPHEYGVGLYLTDSPDYARVASFAGRTPNNPVPGTTRLLEGGVLNKVNAEVRNPLDITGDIEESVRDVFRRAVNDIGGSEAVTKEYQRLMRNRGTDKAWVSFREAYGNVTGGRLPELMYRGFSTQVSNGLRLAGFDGVLDARRGVLVALPDLDGRIRGVAAPLEFTPPASKLQQTYARHWMDANAHSVLQHPVTEAAELQSRMALENAAMEQLLTEYNKNAPDALKATQELMSSERQAINMSRAQGEANIMEAVQTAPEAAMETPAFKKYRDTPLDEACL